MWRSIKIDFKDLAEHFWERAISYCWEQEFGSPDQAKDFEQCWKEFNQRGEKKRKN